MASTFPKTTAKTIKPSWTAAAALSAPVSINARPAESCMPLTAPAAIATARAASIKGIPHWLNQRLEQLRLSVPTLDHLHRARALRAAYAPSQPAYEAMFAAPAKPSKSSPPTRALSARLTSAFRRAAHLGRQLQGVSSPSAFCRPRRRALKVIAPAGWSLKNPFLSTSKPPPEY